MPDELRPDEIQDLWRNQPREAARMSADDVRRKARQFEAATRRGFLIAAVMMAGAAAVYASFLYFFRNRPKDRFQPYAGRLFVLRLSVPQERPGEKIAGRSARGNLCRVPRGTQASARLPGNFEADATVHSRTGRVHDGFLSPGARVVESSWLDDSPYPFAVRVGDTAGSTQAPNAGARDRLAGRADAAAITGPARAYLAASVVDSIRSAAFRPLSAWASDGYCSSAMRKLFSATAGLLFRKAEWPIASATGRG